MFGGYLFLGWLPESLDPQLGVSKDYSLCLEAAFFWAGFPRVWIHNWGFPKIIGDDVYGISFRHLSDTFPTPFWYLLLEYPWLYIKLSWCRKGIGKVSERILGVPQNCDQWGGTTYRASETHRKESERFYYILNTPNRSTLPHDTAVWDPGLLGVIQPVVEHGVDLRPWACDDSRWSCWRNQGSP